MSDEWYPREILALRERMDADIPGKLEDAADYVEKNGWTTGGDSWTGATRCIEGAMAAATGIELRRAGRDDMEAMVAFHGCKLHATVLDYLRDERDTVMSCHSREALWRWNDHVAEDKQEVLDVLRGAAKYARRKEEGLA